MDTRLKRDGSNEYIQYTCMFRARDGSLDHAFGAGVRLEFFKPTLFMHIFVYWFSEKYTLSCKSHMKLLHINVYYELMT